MIISSRHLEIIMPSYAVSFIGGLLIGVAVWLMLAGLGRVTGVSGIAASAITEPRSGVWRWTFLLGLVVGGAVLARLFNASSASVTSPFGLVAAGLLVGFGTVLGGGCTSGHGVCGLGRRSKRSLVATLVFMSAGVVTVAAIRAMNGASA
jgi:uncharacterized protein